MPRSRRRALGPPNPVPRTMAEWVRQTSSRLTINDYVERYHLQALAVEGYPEMLDALYNDHAVEGSLVADDLEAARIIRDIAVRDNNTIVGDETLTTIAKALRVVLHRYGMSRQQRRDRASSPVAPNDSADNNDLGNDEAAE